MTATFWTGSSLSFTNGSKTVTVNTGPSLDSVKANSSLTAGNYNEPVEVKSVSGNTITLYNNWPGSTGTTSATIKPSAAAAASAGVAAQQLITDIQSLVSSASATATANSFVKRDSNGRIKAASPSANDDVVTKGYLGDAATRDTVSSQTDSESGKVLRSFGATGYMGIGSTTAPSVTDANSLVKSGVYAASGGSAVNFPGSTAFSPFLAMRRLSNYETLSTFHISGGGGQPVEAWVRRSTDGGENWFEGELYHSANTNFDTFGGNADNDVIAIGFAASNSLAIFYLPLNGVSPPSSISVTGTFAIRSPSASTKIATGLVPTFASSASSNKVGFLQVSTSGLTAGQPLELQTEGATTKIVANY